VKASHCEEALDLWELIGDIPVLSSSNTIHTYQQAIHSTRTHCL